MMKHIELAQILAHIAATMMVEQRKKMDGEIFVDPNLYEFCVEMKMQLLIVENMLKFMTNVDTIQLEDYNVIQSAIEAVMPEDRPSADFDHFKQFYDAYPKEGRKRGLDVEFKDFMKQKDFRRVAPLLLPAIEARKEHREKQKAAGFLPNMKNMKTWIHQRCWEETMEEISKKTYNITDYDNSNTTFEKL
jgi:hypothetical protein